MDESRPFGTLLKRYRLAAGLTHERLAERSGISVRAISDLERGISRTPRAATIDLLSNALDVTKEERATLNAAARHPSSPADVGIIAGPGQLPLQFTSFIGREHDVRVVRALLRRDDIRLITITGPGGVGKTRLAIESAAGLADVFPGGIRYVSLAAATDTSGIVQACLRALGLPEPIDQPALAAIASTLSGRRTLAVLDNFEHLLAAAPLLNELLAGSAGLKLLVTSRAVLRLTSEQEYPVAPLIVPDSERLQSHAALSAYPSVTLFVDRAMRVRPDFSLSVDNAADVAGICVRVDGLPLALELAAARIKLLPPRALLSRLSEATGSRVLDVLTSGARDRPVRQQTLRDTIAWSHDLLNVQEQQLFRRLAIFSGGCTIDAAQAICTAIDATETGDDVGEVMLLDLLASLLDKNLVYQDAGPDGEPRFQLLETIRAFALERLSAAGELAELRRRHARYYLTMVERGGGLLFAAEHHRLRMAADQDNLRAALHWLVLEG